MPAGKPAGVRCVNLDARTNLCRLWGRPGFPEVCRSFRPMPDACGESASEAMLLLALLEARTAPAAAPFPGASVGATLPEAEPAA